MAADTTRHATSDSLALLLFPFFVCFSPFYLPSFLRSIAIFPFHVFLPPFLLLPPHALLCEGIEFISKFQAGHITTSKSLTTSLTHAHTQSQVLKYSCAKRTMPILSSFVSYKVHMSGKYWGGIRQVCTHTNTLCPEGLHSITHHLE